MVDPRKLIYEPAKPVFTVLTPDMSREQMAANIIAALRKCGVTVKTN